MKLFTILSVCLVSVGVLAESARGQMTTRLKPETAEAYRLYLKAVEKEIEAMNTGALPFLASDKDPRSRLRLQQGDIIVQNFKVGVDIPDGIIHDWHAAMFVPGITAEQMIGVLQSYDNHKDIYPEVVDSKLLSQDGNTFRYFHRLRKKKVLTVVLNTENEARFEKITENRWFVRSTATKITEVKDPGKANETELPVGEDGGFLWRMDAAWRLEESDGGVYAEVGAITLSRSIPTGLGWIVRPFIQSMPRESLEGMLQATRMAVKR